MEGKKRVRKRGIKERKTEKKENGGEGKRGEGEEDG